MKLNNFKTEWRLVHTLMLISLALITIGYILLRIDGLI